jgi:hypothetical protein
MCGLRGARFRPGPQFPPGRSNVVPGLVVQSARLRIGPLRAQLVVVLPDPVEGKPIRPRQYVRARAQPLGETTWTHGRSSVELAAFALG